MSLLKSDQEALAQGAGAPSFSLPNVVDDVTISLEAFKGKIVVLIFMCNHCPFVIPKMDEIAELQNDFKDKDVAVIGINANDPVNYPDDSPENMKRIAEEKGFNYYLFDESQKTAKAYGAVCTPDPFVFDKDHKLVYHGRINDAMAPESEPTKHDLREVLDNLINDQPIETWFEPSQGCSIKWK
jgi:peroxiredoxin